MSRLEITAALRHDDARETLFTANLYPRKWPQDESVHVLAVHVNGDEEPLTYLHEVSLDDEALDVKLLVARVVSYISARYKAKDDFRDRPRAHLHEHTLDMKALRKFVSDHPDIPDEAPVLAERIQDTYFLNYHWATLRIRSHESYHEPHFDSEYHGTSAIIKEKDFNGEDVVVIDAHY